jgi:uncharacterized membrane protein
MDSLSALFLCLGLTFIGIGIPLIQERVPPNRWYGLRVRKTLTNPSVWYAANRTMGYDLVWAGAAVAVTALATAVFARHGSEPLIVAINVTVFAFAMVAATVHSFAALKHL